VTKDRQLHGRRGAATDRLRRHPYNRLSLAELAPEFVDLLRCPENGQPLQAAGGSALVCLDGERYAVRQGIPDLVHDGEPVGFDPERLRRLAELEGWHFWFAGRAALVEELLRDALPTAGDVLDVGCGNGALLATLTRLGHRAVGVDLLAEGLERARERVPSAWLARAAADRLPFPDESFDAALMLDVLEHLDDRAALSEIQRILRPAGVVIACVPANPRLWSHRDEAAGHLRRYTKTSIRRLADETGFVVQRIRPYQVLLFPVVAVMRLLGRSGPRMRDLEERPSPRLNRVLHSITSAERALGRLAPLPWGSSLVVVARKR
jgi:SAM-dependent methyltransferase